MVLHLFVSTFEIAVKVQNELKRKSGGDVFDACVLYISYGDRVHVSVLSNRHRLCGDDRIITFNKTVLCNSEPISGSDLLEGNYTCTVRFSICAVNFDANQSSGKYVREKEVGIASLFCSPLDIAAASKSVIFYDRSSQHIVGRLAVALQYKNTADKSPSKSRPSLQHNPREVAFLLSREMRRSDAARRSFPLPPHRQDRVTFNDNTERIVRREVRRNNFTSLPRPRYAEPTASPSAEKRIQYDRSRNSSPKLRDTAMSVGYVKNKWPDVSDSIMEKSMYRLHLSEQRRLALLQEVEQQIYKRRKAREQHVQRTKVDSQEGQANAVVLKTLLKKKEKEVKQLVEKLRLMQQEAVLSGTISKASKKTRSGQPEVVRKESKGDPAESFIKRNRKKPGRRSATDKESSSTPTPVSASYSSGHQHQSKVKLSKLGKSQQKNDVKVSNPAKSTPSRRYHQSSTQSASSLSEDISLSDYDSAEDPAVRPRVDWLAPARASVHSFHNQSLLKSFDGANSANAFLMDPSDHANNDTSMSSRRFYSYRRVGSDIESIIVDEDGEKNSNSEESSMYERDNGKSNRSPSNVGRGPLPSEGISHSELPSRQSYSPRNPSEDKNTIIDKAAVLSSGGRAVAPHAQQGRRPAESMDGLGVPTFLNTFLGQGDQSRFNNLSSDSDGDSDGAEIAYGAVVGSSYRVASSGSSSGTYSSQSTDDSPKYRNNNNISVEEISFISSQQSEYSYAVDRNLHNPIAQHSFNAREAREKPVPPHARQQQVGPDFVDQSDVSGSGKRVPPGAMLYRSKGDREPDTVLRSAALPNSSSSSTTLTFNEDRRDNSMQQLDSFSEPVSLSSTQRLRPAGVSRRVELTESNIRAREALTLTMTGMLTGSDTTHDDSNSYLPASQSAKVGQDLLPGGSGRDIEGRLNDQLSDIGNAIESLEARIDVFMQSVPKPPRPSGLTMTPQSQSQPAVRSTESVSSTRSLSPDSLRL